MSRLNVSSTQPARKVQEWSNREGAGQRVSLMVDGDAPWCAIVAGRLATELKLSYKGKFGGGGPHLASARAGDGGGQSIDWTGKRVR